MAERRGMKRKNRVMKMECSSLKLFKVGKWEYDNSTEIGTEENKPRINVLQTMLCFSEQCAWETAISYG